MNFRLFTVKKSALKIAENIHVHPKEPGRTSPFLPKESEPCQFLDQRRLPLPSASLCPGETAQPWLGLGFLFRRYTENWCLWKTTVTSRGWRCSFWTACFGILTSQPSTGTRVSLTCTEMVGGSASGMFSPRCVQRASRPHCCLCPTSPPEKPVWKSSLSTAVSFCGPAVPLSRLRSSPVGLCACRLSSPPHKWASRPAEVTSGLGCCWLCFSILGP